jgi:hypothetical protein
MNPGKQSALKPILYASNAAIEVVFTVFFYSFFSFFGNELSRTIEWQLKYERPRL